MVAHLLRHPELAGGFTTVEVEGHGSGAVYHSIAEQVRGRVRPGDLVLLKGSRGLELERLLPVLGAIRRGGRPRGAGGERC